MPAKAEERYDGIWALRTNTVYNAETVPAVKESAEKHPIERLVVEGLLDHSRQAYEQIIAFAAVTGPGQFRKLR